MEGLPEIEKVKAIAMTGNRAMCDKAEELGVDAFFGMALAVIALHDTVESFLKMLDAVGVDGVERICEALAYMDKNELIKEAEEALNNE